MENNKEDNTMRKFKDGIIKFNFIDDFIYFSLNFGITVLLQNQKRPKFE